MDNTPRFPFIFAVLLTFLLVACTRDDPTPNLAPTGTGVPLTGALTIFAASSLAEAFNQAGQAFKTKNPQITITVNHAASSTLRTQLVQGAKADVFASADEENLRQARQAGVIEGEPMAFVRNRLAIVVNKSSSRVAELRDLGKPGIKLIVGDTRVPAGAYAEEAFSKLAADPQYGQAFVEAVRKNTISRAANVRHGTLAVEIGEADAAIAYTTDALVSDKLRAIPFSDGLGVRPLYFLAIVKGAPNAKVARAFIVFLLLDDAQRILAQHGFLKP